VGVCIEVGEEDREWGSSGMIEMNLCLLSYTDTHTWVFTAALCMGMGMLARHLIRDHELLISIKPCCIYPRDLSADQTSVRLQLVSQSKYLRHGTYTTEGAVKVYECYRG
jgi:hypothetical protein